MAGIAFASLRGVGSCDELGTVRYSLIGRGRSGRGNCARSHLADGWRMTRSAFATSLGAHTLCRGSETQLASATGASIFASWTGRVALIQLDPCGIRTLEPPLLAAPPES